MKRKLHIVLVIIGLIIIMYPHIEDFINMNQQSQVLKNISESEKIDRFRMLDDESERMALINEQFIRGSIKEISSKDIKEENSNDEEDKNGFEAVAIMKINKIDLELAVLEGASESNLKIGPSILRESDEFGKIGNVSIAGHRSYTYGTQFNRLDEVEVGDEIQILYSGKQYIYIVSERFVVEPDEVWVLNGNGVDKMITLITCTPIKVATHRLIIRGILK